MVDFFKKIKNFIGVNSGDGFEYGDEYDYELLEEYNNDDAKPGGKIPLSQDEAFSVEEQAQVFITSGSDVSQGSNARTSWGGNNQPGHQRNDDTEDFEGWIPGSGQNSQSLDQPENTENFRSNNNTHSVGLSPEDMQALAAQVLGINIRQDHIEKLSLIQPPGQDSNEGFIKFRNDGVLTLKSNGIFANDVKPEDIGSAASMMVASAKNKGWTSIAMKGHDEHFQDHIFVEAILQGVEIDHKNSPTYLAPTSNALEMLKDRCDNMRVNILDSNGQIDISKAFGLRGYDGTLNEPQNQSMFSDDPSSAPDFDLNQNWKLDPKSNTPTLDSIIAPRRRP